MEPCGGTLSTYFTYKETYAIGQNTYIQLVYDIATHKISKVVVYRKDENQNKKRMIEAASRSFLFLSDDWNCPIKVTKRKVKRIVKKNEEDIKNKNYNPFSEQYIIEGFDEQVRRILIMMMAQTCREFEKLPIIKYTDILRNILYSGVWCRFEVIHKKRKEAGEKDND